MRFYQNHSSVAIVRSDKRCLWIGSMSITLEGDSTLIHMYALGKVDGDRHPSPFDQGHHPWRSLQHRRHSEVQQDCSSPQEVQWQIGLTDHNLYSRNHPILQHRLSRSQELQKLKSVLQIRQILKIQQIQAVGPEGHLSSSKLGAVYEPNA